MLRCSGGAYTLNRDTSLENTPSSDAKITLSCTLPLQQAAVRALPAPFRAHSEDKETRETKRGERARGLLPFPVSLSLRELSLKCFCILFQPFMDPNNYLKHLQLILAPPGPSEKGKVLEPRMDSREVKNH